MKIFSKPFMRKRILETTFVIIVVFLLISEVQAVSLKSGDIIATHYDTAEVFLVDPSSGDLTLISSGGLLIEPSGVALDSGGNILIADTQEGIIHIDPISGTQSLICSLDGAFGIAFGKNGYIYVSTYVGIPPNSNAAIVKVDPSSGIATVISSDENLLIPREIEIDSSGDIVVADQGIGSFDDGAIIRVNAFTGNQTVISSGGMIRTIRGLAIENSGKILVGENRSPPRILRVDPNTGSQSAISSYGFLISPVGLAVEENGSILVADNGTGGSDGAIIRINAVTGVQTLLTSAATSNGMFTNGRGITVVPGTGPPIIYSFIASPTSGEVPLTVAFACVAHDFGGTVDSYTLDYGDLSSLETNTTGLFSYEYVTVGAYDATCTVVDNDGESNVSDPLAVNVTAYQNRPPVADAGTYEPVFDMVILDGSSCDDPDGTIEHYAWKLHHMELGDDIFAEGESPTVSGLVKGFYEVSLIITDNEGAIGEDNTVLPVAGPCEDLDQCLDDLEQCQDDTELCNSDLSQCNDDLIQASGDLTTCSDDLGQCEGNLLGCQTASEQCNSNLTLCNDNLSQAMTNLEMCNENMTQLQEELEKALADLAAATTDTDVDGVLDLIDACPGSASGSAVDQIGCSLVQFCSDIDTSTGNGRKICNKSDWMNDEPLTNKGDCKAVKQGKGSSNYNCIPR